MILLFLVLFLICMTTNSSRIEPTDKNPTPDQPKDLWAILLLPFFLEPMLLIIDSLYLLKEKKQNFYHPIYLILTLLAYLIVSFGYLFGLKWVWYVFLAYCLLNLLLVILNIFIPGDTIIYYNGIETIIISFTAFLIFYRYFDKPDMSFFFCMLPLLILCFIGIIFLCAVCFFGAKYYDQVKRQKNLGYDDPLKMKMQDYVLGILNLSCLPFLAIVCLCMPPLLSSNSCKDWI